MAKPIIRAFKSALLLVPLQVTSLFLEWVQKIIRLNRFLFYQFEYLLHGQQWTKCWV
uniref:Uncharacterized protein n=1 Tax=Rhinopithecus roxellana TaxID=61622 RepID=A0A2K6RE34_RHIRO